MHGMPRKQHPPAGSRPGTLVIPRGSPPPRIRIVEYSAEELVEREAEKAAEIRESLESGRFCWVDVQGLGSEEVLREIAAVFNLHPLALEDVAHVPQRPKGELYPEHHFFTTRMIRLAANGTLDIEQVSIFVGRGWVLTFQERYGDVLDPVRNRLRRGGGMMRQWGVDYLAYAIIDAIVDWYFPVAERVGDALEELEQEVLRSPSRDLIGEINRIRRDLLTLRRAIWPQREAINALLRDGSPMIDARVLTYFRDTHDHAMQIVDIIETYRDLASGLMQTYLSVVGNRTNDVMKVLTIMASIFIPLTFIAGVYGMNFEFMPELAWRWAYPAVLLFMGSSGVGLLLYFRHLGWIGRRGE
jgi:magnesium transporter